MNQAQTIKLDQVRKGAETLVTLTEGRIHEALFCLEEGKFGTAMTRLDEARSKLAPLVNAVGMMAFEEGTSIIRARYLQEGMVITGLGKVVDVDMEEDDHGHEDPCVNVTVKLEDEERPQRLSGDQEVIIRI